MINDKSTKKTQGVRFGIFDVIIILLVLAVIGAIATRAYFISNIKSDYVTAEVGFTVYGVSDSSADAFQSGKKIYLSETDGMIGTMGEFSISPALVYAEDADGKLVALSHPDKKDVTGVASLVGLATEDGFMIDGKVLASVGKTLLVYTEDQTCVFTIQSVTLPK